MCVSCLCWGLKIASFVVQENLPETGISMQRLRSKPLKLTREVRGRPQKRVQIAD